MFVYLYFLNFLVQQLCLSKDKFSPSSFVWIVNLANEEGVFRDAVSDDDHKWTIELQDRDVAEGQKCDADARGTCSGGSGLIHIQGSLVHNLWYKKGTVR